MNKIVKPSRRTPRLVPAASVFAKARKNPAYAKAYSAMDEEFSLLSALIKARVASGLTQEQVADRMATSQGNVARLETGKVTPSLKTLKRYARATGHRLRISLEPNERA